jgi:pyrimidine operon attenuation protein/uracil phosphoribosyltransferase
MMNSMLLDSAALQRTLARMAHEIAEANPDAGSLVLVGIQRGGVPVALRLIPKVHRQPQLTMVANLAFLQ